MSDDSSKKRLGRGLAALIGEAEVAPGSTLAKAAPEPRADRKTPIEHLRANSNNPRRHFDESELDDLARSIREHGIVQPILVRTAKGNDPARFEIIAGERRWRAAQRAGLHEVPVLIREVDDKQALELAIIENVQRADLNALEEARGYHQLIEEHGYSQAELGNVIGKSRSHVANTMRLLKLPKAVQDFVSSGELSAGHARTLVTAADPQALAERIVKEGLSVRQAELLAQEAQQGEGAPSRSPRAPETKSADARAVEKRLSDLLGLAVTINWNEKGTGDIKIRYSTLEQLEGVCRRLENGG